VAREVVEVRGADQTIKYQGAGVWGCSPLETATIIDGIS